MKASFLPYNPKLKEIARKLRKNMTRSEIILWQYLKGKQMLGFDFDRQRPIDEYIVVGFYCKQLKLAIEIDGSSHDSAEAQEQDKHRQKRLETLGVHFLRFRDEDVKQHPEAVLQVIEDWILKMPDASLKSFAERGL
ncbi:MAG: endonuclease domain-containing protein [Cyanobacteria bacterium J06636_16]